MKKPIVHVIEIVHDASLKRLEGRATEAVRRFYPGAAPVKLYRTAGGGIGCQMKVTVAPGERQRWNEAYQAVMKVLGEKRGRPPGVKTVQTKPRLPEPVYSALKKTAAETHSTMSSVVVDSLMARL